MTITDDYKALIQSDSPALYWMLDETTGTTAADSSGNGRTGTLNGGILLGEPGPFTCQDAASKSVLADGVGTGTGNAQLVYRAAPAGFTIGTGDFTMEGWYRPTEDSFDRVGREYQNLGQVREHFPSFGDPNMLRLFVASGTVFGLNDIVGFYAPGGNLTGADHLPFVARADCWTHLAAVRQGTTTRFYLNAQLKASGTSSANIIQGSVSCGGDYPDIFHQPQGLQEMELYRGSMAHFAVYTHALDADAIAERVTYGCLQCGQGWNIGRIGVG